LTNSLGDPIAFFKQAISAPPDVEEFTVREYSSVTVHGLTKKSSSRLTGARAGDNYFLQAFFDANGSNALAASRPALIVGRSGNDQYQYSQNAISYGFGSNGLTAVVRENLSVTRQILDMGMGDTEPDSVKWDGDTFTATNILGEFQYGKLSISNGLPSRLEISAAKGSPPDRMIEYTYPDPSSFFKGFPATISLFGEYDGELIPEVQVQFYSVKLSDEPLSDNFFAAAQFVTPNILYTNVFSNSDANVQLRRGHAVTMTRVTHPWLNDQSATQPHP
jgi:hypothetical protein